MKKNTIILILILAIFTSRRYFVQDPKTKRTGIFIMEGTTCRLYVDGEKDRIWEILEVYKNPNN